ncbi:MAG: HPr family phosphocarrier protein [Acidobacteriia bacterium]|nr:HPr family phosphocarrier protein [Terriglobia bacterium]
MTESEVHVSNRLGLHARAAARFVHLANRFSSRITVVKDGTRVDGKSILGLLTLAAARGTRLRLAAEGDDEREAVDKLADLVRSRFGEDD